MDMIFKLNTVLALAHIYSQRSSLLTYSTIYFLYDDASSQECEGNTVYILSIQTV